MSDGPTTTSWEGDNPTCHIRVVYYIFNIFNGYSQPNPSLTNPTKTFLPPKKIKALFFCFGALIKKHHWLPPAEQKKSPGAKPSKLQGDGFLAESPGVGCPGLEVRINGW